MFIPQSSRSLHLAKVGEGVISPSPTAFLWGLRALGKYKLTKGP